MVFSTPEFLFLFLPVVLILYNVLRRPALQNVLLVLASLIFYGYGEPYYIVLMLLSVLVNFLLVRFLQRIAAEEKGRRKAVLACAAVFNIGMLIVFKYTGFLAETVNSILPIHLPVPNLRLPIGISFYTFQALSLVADIYREGDGKGRRVRFKDVILYISFFPQLIAGPIVQYRDIEPFLDHRRAGATDLAEGIRRFICGLSKKVLLADTLAAVCDSLYLMADTTLSGAGVWLAAITYMLQIYFDFSGYSDMAIGLGRMFGFRFRENFDLPYMARSLREFWRRWHISLSSWFRDYLYIPLGGSRGGKLQTARNRMIVFACTGLWHGAGMNFLLWGLWHGTFVTAEGLLSKGNKNRRSPWGRVGNLYTLLVVLIGFILFRAETLRKALRMVRAMFTDLGLGRTGLAPVLKFCTPYVLFTMAAAILLSSGLVPAVRERLAGRKGTAAVSYAFSAVLLILCILTIASAAYSPFIYFRF